MRGTWDLIARMNPEYPLLQRPPTPWAKDFGTGPTEDLSLTRIKNRIHGTLDTYCPRIHICSPKYRIHFPFHRHTAPMPDS